MWGGEIVEGAARLLRIGSTQFLLPRLPQGPSCGLALARGRRRASASPILAQGPRESRAERFVILGRSLLRGLRATRLGLEPDRRQMMRYAIAGHPGEKPCREHCHPANDGFRYSPRPATGEGTRVGASSRISLVIVLGERSRQQMLDSKITRSRDCARVTRIVATCPRVLGRNRLSIRSFAGIDDNNNASAPALARRMKPTRPRAVTPTARSSPQDP